MPEESNDNQSQTPDNLPSDSGQEQQQPEQAAKLDHWSPVTEAMRATGDPQFTKQGNPIDPPDPGTPLSRTIAIITTILVVAFVVLWQNTPDETKQRLIFGKTNEAAAASVSAESPAPGMYGQVDMLGRIFLRGHEMFQSQPVMDYFQVEPLPEPSTTDPDSSDDSSYSSSGSDMPADQSAMLYTDEDRVRIVMISAEFESTETALRRLEALRLELLDLNNTESIEISSDDLVLQELNILQKLYNDGAESLTEDQTKQLTDRYGYIGRVALTHGKPASDPTRQQLTSGFMGIMLFLLLVGLIVVLGPLAGLVLLIIGMIHFFSGKMTMRARIPRPGGSIYLETYALFVLGFCIMAVGTFFVSNSSMPELGAFSLLVQWLLLLTVFWGLLRGAQARDWKHATGWHTGEGVFKEIGCGIVGYLAALPIYIIGVIITAIILIVKEMIITQANGGVPPEPEPMVNPVFEMVASGDLFIILFLFVLATTWAPIVEESIFRGALYRHFRARFHWVISALFTGILFAFMHDYGPLMVAPLIALGFMFAFMREWRGSIIAPMTAHFLHNFTLMAGMITFVQLIKDPPM